MDWPSSKPMPAGEPRSEGRRLLPNLRKDEALDTGIDEEARLPTEPVDLVPDARNPSSMLGVDKFTQGPRHDQPDVPCRLAPPLLIQQKDVGLQMKRQGDGLGLSRVERNGQRRNRRRNGDP